MPKRSRLKFASNFVFFEKLRVARDRVDFVLQSYPKPETEQALVVVSMLLNDIIKHYRPATRGNQKLKPEIRNNIVQSVRLGVLHKITASNSRVSVDTVHKIVREENLYRNPERRKNKNEEERSSQQTS